MRTLLILTLILAVILGLSTWGYFHIDSTSKELTGHIDKSQQAVAAKNWPAADSQMSQMSSGWQKTKSVWAVLVDHQEMDKIDMTLARVKQALKTKDPVESRAGLAELKMFIRHIPEKEALTLHNIL